MKSEIEQLREDKSRLMLDNASWESTCERLGTAIVRALPMVKGISDSLPTGDREGNLVYRLLCEAIGRTDDRIFDKDKPPPVLPYRVWRALGENEP